MTQGVRAIGFQSDPINDTVLSGNLDTALVFNVTFNEQEQTIEFSDPQVLTVRRRPESRRNDLPFLKVVATNSVRPEPLGSTLVPRRRYLVAEDRGLIETPIQTVVATIPLSGKPEEITVEGDSFGMTVEPLSVERLIRDFCDRQEENEICLGSPVE